jgi:hypothetical protein
LKQSHEQLKADNSKLLQNQSKPYRDIDDKVFERKIEKAETKQVVKGKDGDFDAFGTSFQSSEKGLKDSLDCSDASSMMDIGFGAHMSVSHRVANNYLQPDSPEKLIQKLR